MTTKILTKNLALLGLDDRTQRVYLAILELGSESIQGIAQKAGLERTGVYGIMKDLIRLGLVSEAQVGKKRLFVAENPRRLLDILAERQAMIGELLPSLQSLWQAPDIRPTVRFYEGIEGMRTVLDDTYTSPTKELFGILSMHDLDETVGARWMNQMVKRRVLAGVRLRVIRSHSKEVDERWPSDPKELRELRYAPEGMIFSMTQYIYGHKVALLSTKQENFGIIIESPEFGTNQGYFFEALWQISVPIRNHKK